MNTQEEDLELIEKHNGETGLFMFGFLFVLLALFVATIVSYL